jgi:hypothetical protein
MPGMTAFTQRHCPRATALPTTSWLLPGRLPGDGHGLADAEDRVVVTKDRDFRDSHLLKRTPRRLLVVTTGNITNNDLLALVKANLEAIVTSFDDAAFVELAPDRLIVHR